MKKISTLLCMLYVLLGYSQQQTNSVQAIVRPIQINNEWKNQVNPIFQGLDKTKIPHGILNDYALEFTNVPAYNGTLTDSTYIDANVLGSIYKTLFMGKVTTSAQYFPTVETVANNWVTNRRSYNENEQSTLVVAGLFYQYSRINPQSSFKITVSNNQYFDKFLRGVWQNPYETLNTIAFTPALNSYNKKSFGVVLPQNLMLTNNSSLIQKTEVDFNDGLGYKLLTPDQKVYANYTQNGTYNWVFKTTLTNGSILYSHTKVKIDEPIVSQVPLNRGANDYANNVFISHPNQPLFLAQQGAILRIDYASSHNGQIRKPFIVAEGFDSGSITAPEKQGGDRTLSTLLTKTGELPSAGNNIFNLLLGDNQEYDIIYIDWQNGMHDIKHNSEVLRKVIKWVNAKKLESGSNEPNVLMGQSMGGLIGRYTLAKMENVYSENHDVRLFIAHDSPMQGANTPISTQFFSRHMYDEYTSAPVLYTLAEYIIPTILNFADLMSLGNLDVAFPSLENILTIQDTPAAMQMNYHYVDVASVPTTTVHQVWQQEFDTMGYPQQSENIAISNGNECATNHGFAPGDKFINLHDTDNPDLFGDLVHMIATPVIGTLINDIGLVILGVLPGSSKYYYDFDVHSNPNATASNRQVYTGRIRYEKKLLWLIKITHNVMNRTKQAPLGYLPFDTYSGGFYDINTIMEELPFSSNAIINPRYGFIPVVSALDIKRNNQEVLPSDYLKKYGGGITPEAALTSGFDRFIVDFNAGNTINNRHISFQVRSGNWLARELDEDIIPLINCSFVCENTSISGPAQMCTNGSIYSINVPSNVIPVWTVTQGGNLVTMTNNANGSVRLTSQQYSGTVVLSVTFGNQDCGFRTLTKTITIGNNSTNYKITVLNSYCDSNFQYFVLRPSTSISYNGFSNFLPNAGIFTVPFSGTNDAIFRIPKTHSGLIGFQILAQNSSCGRFRYSFSLQVRSCDNIVLPRMAQNTNEKRYVVYPNPSKNVVNVSLKEENINSENRATITAELFDMFGVSRGEVSIVNNQAVIDVSYLAEGVYVLRIHIDDLIESYEILVQ